MASRRFRSAADGTVSVATEHLEDCNTAYYGSNWDAGGQCTTYPHSYIDAEGIL